MASKPPPKSAVPRGRSPGGEPKKLFRIRIRKRPVILAVLALVLVGIGVAVWALWPYWRLSGQFDDVPLVQPSRLYGSPTVLETGGRVDMDEIISELGAEGYRVLGEGERIVGGTFRRTGAGFDVFLRSFPTPDGPGGGALLKVGLDGRRVASLALADQEVARVALEPPLLATFYGEDVKERRPVRVDELPEELVEAVLAAEDDEFFLHAGISPSGIVRAAWKNLRGSGPPEGGSTITQQLVKNLYLTHEKTLSRKVREAFLAIFLELRHSKRAILQAYLNEIYLGSASGVNLIGVGAASRAYFGKDPSQLDLAEAATIAGMIRSPANYDPIKTPEEAKDRRNWVLDRMVKLDDLEPERAERVKQQPVTTAPEPVVRRRAPYFADHVVAEAERRFGIEDLADGGYTLLSTLDWSDQQTAQAAVEWGLDALEGGWEKGNDVEGPLQAALVSVDPTNGGILAYVGGRDYSESQFDRVALAERQAGSAFKPVVYATALEQRLVTPATLIEDTPLTVKLPTQRWTPRNYDGAHHGWVRVRAALERSYNVATARLALQTGLDSIVETARRLGITTDLQALPALALGAFEVTPLEMARVYSTFATMGLRPEIHGLRAVLDRRGRPVEGLAVSQPEAVLSDAVAYVVTSMLQGVLVRGTGAGARRQGLEGPLAGKTGTTNGRRDNWFAGYSPRRTTVVWVGYDDNAKTRMSGARAAVPLWTRFTIRVAPPGGYDDFPVPRGVTTAVIDPETGELATDYCPQTFTEVFLVGYVPAEICHEHRGFWRFDDDDWRDRRGRDDDRPGRLRRWLDRVFGDDEEDERDEPPVAVLPGGRPTPVPSRPPVAAA